ncbi:CDP-diacylglycerol diphosphatase [Acinetobacter brisouii]|uniref:CDP-diacylglycerol diphosphatase n=1 Tax=Acinetobacter brisouii TaxID=396323 RepID=UPI00148F27AF|nr:CDP-diacylglycerol diphosphatase [Acinetobacter brisouii]
MSFNLRQSAFTLLGVVILFIAGCQTLNYVDHKRNILWEIVHERCGTPQDKKKDCLVMQPDYIVLRDIHGPVQTLIIPTQRVRGIEDKKLLQMNIPNYFEKAWQHRDILDQQHNQKIDPAYLSFTVNSKFGRTQDQLHIHSSCLRSDVYKTLQQYRSQISDQWQPLPEKILGHRYIAKRISLQQLAAQSPFLTLWQYVQTQQKESMEKYGLGMVSISQGEAILLATQLDLTELNKGSIEEIQDTHCTITHQTF